MIRKLIAGAALMALSATTLAEWSFGVNSARVSDDDAGSEINLGVIGASFGYIVNPESAFRFVPEIRAGVGVSDDSVSVAGVSVKGEINHYYGLNLRGEYSVSNSVYVFGAPSYTNYDL